MEEAYPSRYHDHVISDVAQSRCVCFSDIVRKVDALVAINVFKGHIVNLCRTCKDNTN